MFLEGQVFHLRVTFGSGDSPCMHNAKVRLQLWSPQLCVVIPELTWVKLTLVDHGTCTQGRHVEPETWFNFSSLETYFEPGSILWDSVCCNLSQSESSPAHLFKEN